MSYRVKDADGQTITIQAGTAEDGSVLPQSFPASGVGMYSPATANTTESKLLDAGVATVFLDVINCSLTATIAIAFGAVPTINGAGSITLPPGWHRSWEGSAVPSDQINVISSQASTPITIGVK